MELKKKMDSMKKSSVEPLDYSKVENWIINANADLNTDFDLIYFCGTTVAVTDQETGAALMNDEARATGYRNYMKVGSQLSDNARIFCPLQRQMTLKYLFSRCTTHHELMEEIAQKEPYIDLEAALDYYFEHYNKGAKDHLSLPVTHRAALLYKFVLFVISYLPIKKTILKI